MYLHFLLEEESAEAALRHLVPKIVGTAHTVHFHPHQGKRDLLQKLPILLRGYRRWVRPEHRIIVLVDEDRDDCRTIKQGLEAVANRAGFPTKSNPDRNGRFVVLNRLAIEELEAWFFGDVDALAAAFPGVPHEISGRRQFRDPDAVPGGTWEQLERVLKRAGYYRGGMPKIETADLIARHMDPSRNTSRSFRNFVNGLRAL